MELTAEQVSEIEEILRRLEAVDPVAMPEPAAELADTLNRILEETERN